MPLVVPRPIAPETAVAHRAEGWWLDVTVTDLLRRRAAERPEAPAIIAGDRTLTFADVDRESDRVAAGLARLGVGCGDVVSCQLSNIPEVLVLHHAVAKCRAIFNPIHPPYRAAEVEHILTFAESRVMVVGPPHRGFSFLEMVLGLRPRMPVLRHVVAVGGGDGPDVLPWGALRAGAGDGSHAGKTPHPDDPFILLFTSGTTASPKAALHTHNMRMGNAKFSAEELGFADSDRFLSIARFSHMWGIFSYWMSLWAGASQVLLETFSPQAFLEAAARAGATVAIGAPAHVAAVLDLPGVRTAGVTSLRLFGLSGSVCPPALARGLREALGCVPFMLWGMTETAAGLYTRPDDPPEVIEQTVGRASRGCTFAILDENGRALPPGMEGELAMRSPFAFEGYVNNSEATAESFTQGGWFRTGDLANMDAAGNVRILGRGKEQINRGGVKFHPADVEDVLAKHPRVQMAALVAMPDERLGERACCFMVPRPGQAPPGLADLTAFLAKAGVAKFKWPERLEMVEALPLTPTGKVQRTILRARIQQQLEAEAVPAAGGARRKEGKP
jgi:non-ribosomal peptide synthetase component E (peptide arylation enzyme)